MSLDDAAAILDIGEGHLQNLIREGKVLGSYRLRGGRLRHAGMWTAPGHLPNGEWWVDGQDVRRRKREQDKKRRGRR